MGQCEKISCEGYIMAAIQTLRRNPPNITPGVMAGVSLKRIFAVVQAEYSREEFLHSLQTLVDNGVVLLAAHVNRVQKDLRGRPQYSRPVSTRKEVRLLPSCADPGAHSWYVDDAGNLADPKEVSGYTQISEVRLYIMSEKKPRHIARLQHDREKIAALAAKEV